MIILAYIPAQSLTVIVALRALEGIATVAVLPPARAMMNTLAPATRQSEALGLLTTAQATGILLGPAAGTFLASRFGYAPPFVTASAFLFVCTALVLVMMPPRSASSETLSMPKPLFAALFTPGLLLAYALRVILAIPSGTVIAIWSLYMADRGAALPLIGLSFTTFALAAIVATPLTGRLSDRYGRYWPIMIGLLCSGAVYLLFALPLSPLLIVGISVAEGAAAAIARTAVDGLLADHTPAALRGRVQATFSAASILGALIGATSAGIFYSISPGLPFLLEGLLILATALILFVPVVARLTVRPRAEEGA